MKIRVPIKISVYDKETHKLVNSEQFRIKTRAIEVAGKLLKEYPVAKYRHECKVSYSRLADSYNEFEYTTGAQFEVTIASDLELVLLREFVKVKMMEKEYLKA